MNGQHNAHVVLYVVLYGSARRILDNKAPMPATWAIRNDLCIEDLDRTTPGHDCTVWLNDAAQLLLPKYFKE